MSTREYAPAGCLTHPDLVAGLAAGDIGVSSVTFPEPEVGPNSIDLHLGDTLARYRRHELDAREENLTDSREIPEHGLVLKPGILYLGRTDEIVSTPKHVPLIGGRSSTGRLGISIHATAGFGDVGFWGTWTLEISVIQPVRIYPGMKIAQLWLFTQTTELPPELRYRGRYQGQLEPRPCADKEWR